MKTVGKVLIGAAGALGLGGLIYAATRPTEAASQPVNPGLSITFTPVGYRGPARLGLALPVVEGQQTVMTVKVTNTSTQYGQPVAASLTTKINASLDDNTSILAVQTLTDNYGPGGSKTYTYTLTAPLGKGGHNINGYAYIYDPNGDQLNNNAGAQAIVAIGTVISIPYSYIQYPAAGTTFNLVSGTPSVPYGQDISLAFAWKNGSSVALAGHIAIKVVAPDGTVSYPSVTAGQDHTAQPSEVFASIAFASFNGSQVGNYTVTETVTYQGEVAATYTYTIAVQPAPIIYGATVTVG